MIYGLTKKNFDSLLSMLKKVFKDSGSQAYLFGSRSRGDHRKNSDIDLLVRSKDKTLSEKYTKLEDLFEESDIPYKLDLVNWQDLNDSYKKNINKDKIKIWESQAQASKWRICPTGQHWVKRHLRTTKKGKVADVDGHCRKNPSGKEILTGDEIDEIAKLPAFKNATPKTTRKTFKYPNANKFNQLITGWTAFWNDVYQPKKKLPPNLVKALIASESEFKTTPNTKNTLNVGFAQGLVQLTQQTQKILKDRKGELKNYYIDLKGNDIWEPNKNVCAAVRWLFRKKEIAKHRLKREPSWEEVLWEYKGITKQKHPRALRIKKKLKELIHAFSD